MRNVWSEKPTALRGRKRGSTGVRTFLPIRTPTQKDLAWAAGFLEGEGSFEARRNSQVVRASQVNPEPLQRLLELFGGRVVLYRHKPSKPTWNPYWHWAIHGQLARDAMVVLFEFMSEYRQQQITEALSSCLVLSQ